jgi:hypothetical protein
VDGLHSLYPLKARAGQALRQRRTEDLLVYVALARFKTRLPLMQLPQCLRYDMRAFFGT